MQAIVHAADVQDRDGGAMLMATLFGLYPFLVKLYGKRCSATLGLSAPSGWVVGLPIPRHQFVDAFLRPAVDEACQQIRKIGLRIDAIEFAGLDQ